MANGLTSGYGFGPNVRRIQAMHLIPLLSGADPDVYTFDSGGAVLDAGGSPSANTASGTPTHIGVFLVKLGTPRAGTIAAPSVTFDLGAGT
jgi:hypothetical protein